MNAVTKIPEIVFPNLGITIDKLDNIFFTISTFSIYWYGFIMTLAIMAGVLAALVNSKRMGLSPDYYSDFTFFVIPICVIGARLYYVIFEWDNYKNNLLSIFNIREGGLAIYGAVIAAFLTALVYTRKKKIGFFGFTDIGVVGLVLGQAIGRWGNFFNREAFGGYTNNLFAMRYLMTTVSETIITEDLYKHAITINGAEYIQVHPTFFYESVWNFALFAFLWFYSKRKKFDGEVTIIYLMLYGFARFWIEGLRTDSLMLFGTHVPVSQFLSSVLFVFGLVFLAYKHIQLREPEND